MPTKEIDNATVEAYNRYRQPFFGFVKKKYSTLSSDEIEDIYHETILAYRQNLIDGRVNSSDVWLQGHLFTIGRNKAVDFFRKAAKDGIRVDIETVPDPFDSEEDVEEKRSAVIYKAVNQMENPCKTILLLFYYEEKNMII